MPSLKDLKNRIASVKATRKITKAMQMVAAAKLRRAQEAAEAARPYAESMARFCQPRRRPWARKRAALMAGTGKDQVHLLVVMTAERGLCGGFNSNIAGLPANMRATLLAEGKTVKILTVGKKGREQLKRDLPSCFVDHVDLSEVKRIGYARREGHRARHGPVRRRRVRRRTLFYSQFKSVISQVPTAQQLIPANSRLPMREKRIGRCDLRLRAVGRGDPGGSAAAQHRVQIFTALLKTPHPSRARGCPQWTTPPAMPAR
jgi:F-type H+-transporting ATPase subunit gamma